MSELRWNRTELSLSAYTHDEPDSGYITFITEEDMVEVANWCKEHKCGVRTSWDTFKFKNEKSITAFLLRWG